MARLWVLAIAIAGCAPTGASLPPRRAAATPAPERAAAPPDPVPPAGARARVVATPAAEPGSAPWATHFGGTGSVQGTGVAVAADGTVLLAGQFSKGMSIGNRAYESAGNEDVFVAALSADGAPRWSRVFGGPGHAYASAVAVDAAGAVYVTGFFTGAIDFGNGAVRSAGVHDIFLVKLAHDGKLVWARRYGDAADQVSLRVYPDPGGQLIAAGYARGSVRFGKRVLSSYPDKATFFARLDADGNALWSMGFGHIYDYAYPAAVTDAAGHVFFSAGSDPPGAHKPRQADLGLVLGELDDAGKRLWQKRVGGGSANMGTSIGLEPNGDIVTAGSFGGTLDFGDGALRAEAMSDLFVARLDARGVHLWSRRFSGTQLQSIAGAVVAPDGSIVIAGQFSRGTLALDSFALAGAGMENGFVARLSPRGRVVSAKCLCADRLAWLSSLALDASGDVIVAGAFAGTLVGGSAQLASFGAEDALVARLRP